jgi:hypothetical protein
MHQSGLACLEAGRLPLFLRRRGRCPVRVPDWPGSACA